MQTADFIRIPPAASSVSRFIGDIWSKSFNPKARLRVQFSMVRTTQKRADGAGDLQVLRLSATNIGSVEITLKRAMIVFREAWFAYNSYGTLHVLPDLPQNSDSASGDPMGELFAGGFPKKLALGEQFSVYLVPDHETLASGDYQRIGFQDTFGRSYWAPRRNVVKTLPFIREACSLSGKNWRA